MSRIVLLMSLTVFALSIIPKAAAAADLATGEVYTVIELEFAGPQQGPTDTPARDIDFAVTFRHQSGSPQYRVHGFWDGDGMGSPKGKVFKVRFCPTKEGRWNLAEVESNVESLNGRHKGDYVTATAGRRPGFWMVDEDSAGRRWYRRSDGSHQYIYGNTHYSFLSGYKRGGRPTGNNIVDDVAGNAEYFKKLRFGLSGDYYPHPSDKPFFTDKGIPTDLGDYSHRPNPEWFGERVDLAVATADLHDLIADLILAGPDTEESRSTLRARDNDGDPSPFLKYIAARYGSYPNVWICLCNEYDIRTPKFTEKEVAGFGTTIRKFLPYPTPVSVHATPRKGWSPEFDRLPEWYDHIVIQNKLRHIAPAADVIQKVWQNPDGEPRRKPIINDELSYEGEGDKHTEGDTIEAHLGAFLGGGYGTTGEKPGSKLGQYFRGNFNPAEHTAADNLRWLRETIDRNITFWKMAPDTPAIFSNLDNSFRAMAWPGREYVLGTNRDREGLVAQLPDGRWSVMQYDVVAKEAKRLAAEATGRFTFDAPPSRAVLFHFRRLGD